MTAFNSVQANTPDFSGEGKATWFALRVRSNFERTVSDILQSKGFEEFLPTYRCLRRWSDRMKDEELPLFPGYLFCRLDQYDRFPVLSTTGVVGIVGIGKTPEPVAVRELESVWRITHSDLFANPWPYLQAGEAVVIEAGPLTGVEGVLIESKSERRLVVSVSLLQRSVAVELGTDQVRPLRSLNGLIGSALSGKSLDPGTDRTAAVASRKGPAQAGFVQKNRQNKRLSVGD